MLLVWDSSEAIFFLGQGLGITESSFPLVVQTRLLWSIQIWENLSRTHKEERISQTNPLHLSVSWLGVQIMQGTHGFRQPIVTKLLSFSFSSPPPQTHCRDFPIRGIQFYDGPISVENCTFRKFAALEGRHTSALAFRLNNAWQSCPNNNVTNIIFEDVPVRYSFDQTLPLGLEDKMD